MKTKFSKILKTAAVGTFFIALLMNVKLSLTDPFLTVSNDALAQSSSSSSSGYSCSVEVICDDGGSISCTGTEDCHRWSGRSVTCDGKTTWC